jgi:16S rRNA (uracil1498-N3)-methyltransferase
MKQDLSLKMALKIGDEFELDREHADWVFDFALRPGNIVSLKDKGGSWFRARALKCGQEQIRVVVFERMLRSPESELFLILLQAVPNKERMELIIEKAVELGVDVVQPFFSRRSYRFEDLAQSKHRRWQERARKASEQCRRGKVPRVLSPLKLEEAVEVATVAELGMVLYEKERGQGIMEALQKKKNARSCALAAGPEGGFEESEIEWLAGMGLAPVSLGGRILRTETSSIVATGIVQFFLGDLGGSRE